MPKDIDKKSRDKIRSIIGENYFVEAGAGSGKTSVLVDRMVAMVENGVDISKICAITFTKAAAGEFYARFQKKLSESKSENAAKALKDIDLCFMGTIDAFCNMVLSEHPMEARIPSDAGILSDDERAAIYKKEYSKILNGELGDSALKAKAKRFSGCFYKAVDIFAVGIKTLSESKNAEFNHHAAAESIDASWKDEKAEVLRILKYLMDHPEAVAADSPVEAKKSWDALLDGYDTLLKPWDDNINSVQRILKSLAKLRIVAEYESKMDDIGPGWEHFFTPHVGKGAWLDVNTEEDPFMADKLMDLEFDIAADFLADCVDVISDDLRAEGSLTFFDYLLYLRDLLKEDAGAGGKLIRHIYSRHSYFLIDEFQDTNPLQAEVFFYLTAQTPKENWMECIPKKGSLFIVGDPKQSIYRFRNADVAAFLRVRKLFENPDVGEVLHLTRNFRSSDDMCAWFNKVFTRLLPKDSESQSKFNEIPTGNGEKKPYTGTLRGAYTYTVQNTKRTEDFLDPLNVASIIKGIVSDPKITIQDRDVDGAARDPRSAQYKDFMLITPSTTHLASYMRALSAYGVPFRVEGKVLFDECDALISLSRIMSAVADPYDGKAMFAALSLSGCRIEKDKIFDYSKQAKSMTPVAVFNMLLEEERIFAKTGVHNAEYVYFALELLRSAELDGTVTSVKEGAAYIAGLIGGEYSEERCIQLRRDANRVHIANLHKVKGLEAPIVILADPKSKKHDPSCRVDYMQTPPQSYLFALEDLKSTGFKNEMDEEAKILDEETLRLLYVAATRAGDALIMADIYGSKKLRMDSNPWLPLVSCADQNISTLIDINKAYEPDIKKLVNANDLYDEAEKNSVLKNDGSLVKSYEIKRPSTITLKGVTSSEDDFEDKAADEIKKLRYKKNPTLVGTLVHKVMEALVSSGNSADPEKLVKETVLEFGADEDYYADLLTEVVKMIRSGGYKQENAVPEDILSELLSADEVFCELPFCYTEDEVHIWHGVMDAVYFKDGKWHIIDYKTNADASDLDVHYQDQLKAYIKAFKEMTGEDADALVYHIAV